MKFFMLIVLLACAGAAFADAPSGKISVCRDKSITAMSDRVKVIELRGPIFFRSTKIPETRQRIELEGLTRIGSPTDCHVLSAVLIGYKLGDPLPKKGSAWRADADAKEGTRWGALPVVTDSNGGTSEVFDPSKGGKVDTVALRATVMEDFK